MSNFSGTPYSFSNFGRTYTAVQDMEKLMQNPDASALEMRKNWEVLYPLMQTQLLIKDKEIEENDVKSFMNDFYTGMTNANTNGLPEQCAETWDRLRVLQGLVMHLQIWVWFSAHFVLKHPDSSDMFDWNARHLISEIYMALQANDSIEELEEWVEKVIHKAIEDEEKEQEESSFGN